MSSVDAVRDLANQYASIIDEYVKEPTEAARERAYQLTTDAISHGLGVLDVGAAQREALLAVTAAGRRAPEQAAESELILQRASEVLLEGLVPFEMTHRGYVETIRKLLSTNEALQESEARNLALLSAIPDAIFRLDREGTFLDFEAGTTTGMMPTGNVVGKKTEELLPAELAQGILGCVERARELGVTQVLEYRWEVGEEERSYEIRLAPTRRAEVLGIVRDITEPRRAEAERERLIKEITEKEATLQAEYKAAVERENLLRQVRELAEVAQQQAGQLQGVLENMVDAVFVCAVDGRLTLTNEAGVRLFGMDNIAGTRQAADLPALLRIRHGNGKSYKRGDMPIARALKGETVGQEEQVFFNPRTQRDMYVRTSAAPIRDESGKIVGAVAVARDVTELTELDRLKDQFISVAAHELKTPVAIMKGYAQLLLRQAEEASPRRRKMLEALDRGAGRIDSVVRDLLDVSKLQAGRLDLEIERIDLPALVAGVVDRMALIDAKHRIRLVSEEPAVVKADQDRVEQVVANLVDNAIKYSPGGGDIDVAVRVVGRSAAVSVSDHGIGIPADKQRRIFQRFYSAHTDTPYDFGGMGVGLYISNQIVKRHGGRMWFESEAGKGSTFYFSLPLPNAERIA